MHQPASPVACSGGWGAGDSDLTIENAGTIEGIAFDGISVANGTVTNAGSGALIRTGDTGIFVDVEGEVTNEDGAAITASNIGVTIADFGTLTNSGADTRITATARLLQITSDAQAHAFNLRFDLKL